MVDIQPGIEGSEPLITCLCKNKNAMLWLLDSIIEYDTRVERRRIESHIGILSKKVRLKALLCE